SRICRRGFLHTATSGGAPGAAPRDYRFVRRGERTNQSWRPISKASLDLIRMAFAASTLQLGLRRGKRRETTSETALIRRHSPHGASSLGARTIMTFPIAADRTSGRQPRYFFGPPPAKPTRRQ